MNIKSLSLFLFILSLIFLSACGKRERTQEDTEETKTLSAAENTGDYGDALSTGEIAEPINLIPAMAADSASHNVTQYIYNGLVKYDKNLKITGDLAERWEISPDKKVIVFYLKKGVKWHDGEEFTAEDVKFTYEFMVSDDTPTAYDSDFRFIESVEVIDPYTVRITYKEVLAAALNSWGIWIMPKHALIGKPAKSPLQRKPIGTGPYKLESWTSGQSVILTAFHDYFEGRPKIEKIFIRVIPNQTTQFMELLNGSIDIMNLTPKQNALDTNNGKYQNNYNTYSYLDFAYTYIGYNMRRSPFNEKEVRRALTYATPKNDIIDGLLYGKGKEANGPYKPDSYWNNPKAEKLDYDPEKAIALLREAGFEDKDGDGILERNGKKLSVEIMTNQGNDIRAKIAEIVQHSWGLAGIEVKIKQLEWATMLGELNKGNFEAVILGWTTVLDPDQYDIWSSARCGSGQNFVCYKNDEADALLEAGRREFDEAKRKKYYDKLQEILAEDQPYTFLYFPDAHIAVSKRFMGVEPSPAGITHNFIDWYAPKENQKYSFPTAE